MDTRSGGVRIVEVAMLTYAIAPRSVYPPLFDPVESMYPYMGYRSTARMPEKRTYHAIVVENDLLRVTVLPELGGRILQIEDVKTGGTYVHLNDAVRPVRIPPRWAFLSLGIELNFPFTHSPTGIDRIGFQMLDGEDFVGVAVGERELRLGLFWRAEIKLYRGFRGVCVAARGWNPTSKPCDVQWWSNCAQPAGGDTEFVYPSEPVLAHLVGEQGGRWPVVAGRDLRFHRNYDQMCGMFWEPTNGDWFGIYHHERGWGLLHLADPATLPGKKLWSFGYTGEAADWTLGMTRSGDRCCEIQAGVPTLQKEFVRLRPGESLSFVEFWIPVDSRDELDPPRRPSFASVVQQLGGIENLESEQAELDSPSGAFWRGTYQAFQARNAAFLQDNREVVRETWPPTGLDLEDALVWASEIGGREWRYQLAVWYCAREQYDYARDLLSSVISEDPEFPHAHAILGLLQWKADGNREAAWEHIHTALGILPDGQLLVHANALLREMGRLEERSALLDLWPSDDFRRRETEAEIALDSGDPETAIQILTESGWERHHCRHRRGDLWRQARRALGLPTSPVPAILGEDPVQVDEGPSMVQITERGTHE